MSTRKITLAIGIGTLILLCSALILGHSQEGNNIQETSSALFSVENSQRNDDISLDAAFDSTGSIHLLYASLNKEISYQRSTDSGQNWSAPILLTPVSIDIKNQYKIAFIGSTLYAFWISEGDLFQRFSVDGGFTWSLPTRILSDNHIGYFSMIVFNQVIYLIYSGKISDNLGTYFQKSADAGLSWSSPARIKPEFKDNGWNSIFSMAISQNYIHIVRQIPDQKAVDGTYSPRFYYIRSRDLGETWDDIREIQPTSWPKKDEDLYQIEKLKIAASNNSIWVAFQDIELYYILSTDNGDRWSTPKFISDAPPYKIWITATGGNVAAILWVDYKNAKHPFWAHIPIIDVLFSWDDSPYWDNNSLYCAIIKNDTLMGAHNLTPGISYTELYYSGLACENIGNDLMILWSGKEKIGKRVGSSPDPFKIFYEFINLPSGPPGF